MGDYQKTKGGSLKLKGNKKSLFKADKPKKKVVKKDASSTSDPDVQSHGGWWRILDDVDMKGGINVSFEQGNGSGCYLSALDNGKFTVGGPHPPGEGPNPEEIFAVVKTPDETKISLKTGYGKYVGVNSDGELIASAEAIGARERFQPVFQDGKSALQAVCNPLFLSMIPDKEGHVFVASRKASEDEMINIRTDSEKTGPVDWRSADDKKNAKECETSYVKMYQHSKVDLKGRHIAIDVDDKKGVKRAQNDGDLHEHLLDRRMKMKSDRYC